MKTYKIKWVKRNKSGVIQEIFGTLEVSPGFMIYWKSSPLLVGKMIKEGHEVVVLPPEGKQVKIHKFGDFVRSGRDDQGGNNLDNLPEPPDTIPVPWVEEG